MSIRSAWPTYRGNADRPLCHRLWRLFWKTIEGMVRFMKTVMISTPREMSPDVVQLALEGW